MIGLYVGLGGFGIAIEVISGTLGGGGGLFTGLGMSRGPLSRDDGPLSAV